MTDDKFILVGLEDAGDVAEALKSKTCKKILDYLSDIKEASEKDIADALKMPINTVEYNPNKLIKSRLIEKTKNFFWSVKGKKIPMYKLARKHIVISPNKNFSLLSLKNILPVILVSGIIGVFVKYFFNSNFSNNSRNLKDVAMAAPSVASAETLVFSNNLSLIDKLLMLPFWVWFLAGALIGIFIYFIFKKYKEVKNGKIN